MSSIALALIAKSGEGAELVERMERFTFGVFGEAICLGEAVGFAMQGMGAFLASFFCFTSSMSAR